MTINQKLVPAGCKNNPNRDMAKVEYITIHNTGNYDPGSTAKANANYLYNGSGGRQASWHYTVDANEIWQSFADKRMCWHAGDGSGKGNSASIGIEICVNDKAGFATACDLAAQLVAFLLHKHGLGAEAVKQHFDWSGKDCPSELRSGRWGVDWVKFIEMVEGYFAPPVVVPDAPSDWAKDDWAWGLEAGVTKGGAPQGPLTREQGVAMVRRGCELMKTEG